MPHSSSSRSQSHRTVVRRKTRVSTGRENLAWFPEATAQQRPAPKISLEMPACAFIGGILGSVAGLCALVIPGVGSLIGGMPVTSLMLGAAIGALVGAFLGRERP